MFLYCFTLIVMPWHVAKCSAQPLGSGATGKVIGHNHMRNQFPLEGDSPYTEDGFFREVDNIKSSTDGRERKHVPPPPPRKPPTQAKSVRFSQSTDYDPIHYPFASFRNSRFTEQRLDRAVDNDDMPLTSVSNEEGQFDELYMGQQVRSESTAPSFASPRRDAVTKQLSTLRGRIALRCASSIVGAAIGYFVGFSLTQQVHFFLVAAMGTCFFLISYFRNPYGELVRALGLSLLWIVQRWKIVRSEYPSWPHIKASLAVRPRVGFPNKVSAPADEEGPTQIVQFNQLYCMMAMCLVGALCGGNMPWIPTWMGALVGAGTCGVATSFDTARGDLARLLGMRVVAVCEELLDIQGELQVLRKLGIVSTKVLDKLLILDRKHGVRDRIVSGVNFLYTQLTNAVRSQDGDRRWEDGDEGDDPAGRRQRYEDDRKTRRVEAYR